MKSLSQNFIVTPLISFLIGIIGCSEGDLIFTQEKAVFALTDAEQTGFSFVNSMTETEQLNVIKYGYLYNGSGVGLGDINNDGLIDIIMASYKNGCGVFINKGDFKFEDISLTSGIKVDSFVHGITLVDINEDGYLDIYLSRSISVEVKQRANLLYINNKDNTFVENAKEYGLDDKGFTTHSNFFDYDNDGDLDLFVLNHSIRFDGVNNIYTKNQQKSYLQSLNAYDYEDMISKLYRNNGNNSFTDVTRQAGLLDIYFGLNAIVSDINNDGFLDIYTSGDFISKDHLYMNNGNGTFTDKIDKAMGHISNNSMGSDVADFNNDGLLDIVTLDMTAEDNFRNKQLRGSQPYDMIHHADSNDYHLQVMRNCLQLNNGDGTFSEIGQLAGISHTDWSWAPLFADFDNDGKKDLFISNGYSRDMTDMDYSKYRSNEIINAAGGNQYVKTLDLVTAMTSTPIPNYVYRNVGDFKFEKKSDAWGLKEKSFSNGAAYADLDNDGDLDLVINNINTPSFLYRNNTVENNPENKFLGFVFAPEQSSRIQGTSIKLFTDSGIQYQQLINTRGYLSTMQQILHFGLGKNNAVQKVEIAYPNGTIQTISNPELNKQIVLDISQGMKGSFEKKTSANDILSLIPNAFSPSFKHIESDFNDFKDEPLLEEMYSNRGPFMSTADVNGDKIEDIYIGGAAGQPGMLYIQTADNRFTQKPNEEFNHDKKYEDGQSVFFDADGDGDQDLYVTSGSNEVRHDSLFANRLYINDGTGNFTSEQIPSNWSNTLAVEALDIDGDQDIDLIVGGNVKQKSFPLAYDSYVLVNGGKGNFAVAQETLPGNGNLGIVSDLAILDVDGDGTNDIIAAGHWSPIRVLINSGGKFTDKTESYGLGKSNGLWNCIELMDVNGDGKKDIVAGNRGLNNFYQCSEDRPATIYYDDFDYNKEKEAVVNYYLRDGIMYPKYSLDELLEQLPSLRGMFTKYEDYSKVTSKKIFDKGKYPDMMTFRCHTFASTAFILGEKKFESYHLPSEAQFAPVNAIANLGTKERTKILTAGNNYRVDVNTGRYDADYGVLSYWNDAKKSILPDTTDLSIIGEKRGVKILGSGDKKMVIISRNNGSLLAYGFKSFKE